MRLTTRLLNNTKKSALAERFQNILDEQISHSTGSLIDKDPSLRKLYDKYNGEGTSFDEAKLSDDEANKRFQYQYQKELAYVKSEPLLRSKEDRNLEKPWTGSEAIRDTALRMLVDSAPKPKPMRKSDRIMTPPVPLSDRVRNAKETSLDYTISKGMSSEEKEREAFREEYKERLLGPSMFVDTASSKATLGLVATMADARINAEIDNSTGKFRNPEMQTVRGKPLDKERLSNSRDSNFFLNEILLNQDCLPTWIENQQGVDREVQAFRHTLRVSLHKELMSILTKNGTSIISIRQTLNNEGASKVRAKALQKYLSKQSNYIRAKIDELNRGIRNYNLQCPSSSLHKWKLVQDTELQRVLDSITSDMDALIEQYSQQATQPASTTLRSGSSSLLGILESRGSSLHTAAAPQRPQEGLQFWKSVKDIFRS